MERMSNMVKLLAMAQNIKNKTSVTHVLKLNGLDRLIGRSLGESEFRSQYSILSFTDPIAWNDIETLGASHFTLVSKFP
jgi:hypothetical protein